MGLDIWVYVGENKEKIKRDEFQREYYYRKVNFLFDFFAKNVEEIKNYNDINEVNARDIELNIEIIKKLVESCEEVLKDHSKASTLLPTYEGFFFGNTDYNYVYFTKVRGVLSDMKELLCFMEDNPNSVIIYHPWY